MRPQNSIAIDDVFDGVCLNVHVITGSFACSAKRGYLSYSKGSFEVFAAQGPHVAPMGVQFGTEEGTKGPHPLVPSSMPNFTPIGATTRV